MPLTLIHSRICYAEKQKLSCFPSIALENCWRKWLLGTTQNSPSLVPDVNWQALQLKPNSPASNFVPSNLEVWSLIFKWAISKFCLCLLEIACDLHNFFSRNEVRYSIKMYSTHWLNKLSSVSCQKHSNVQICFILLQFTEVIPTYSFLCHCFMMSLEQRPFVKASTRVKSQSDTNVLLFWVSDKFQSIVAQQKMWHDRSEWRPAKLLAWSHYI